MPISLENTISLMGLTAIALTVLSKFLFDRFGYDGGYKKARLNTLALLTADIGKPDWDQPGRSLVVEELVENYFGANIPIQYIRALITQENPSMAFKIYVKYRHLLTLSTSREQLEFIRNPFWYFRGTYIPKGFIKGTIGFVLTFALTWLIAFGIDSYGSSIPLETLIFSLIILIFLMVVSLAMLLRASEALDMRSEVKRYLQLKDWPISVDHPAGQNEHIKLANM